MFIKMYWLSLLLFWQKCLLLIPNFWSIFGNLFPRKYFSNTLQRINKSLIGWYDGDSRRPLSHVWINIIGVMEGLKSKESIGNNHIFNSSLRSSLSIIPVIRSYLRFSNFRWDIKQLMDSTFFIKKNLLQKF